MILQETTRLVDGYVEWLRQRMTIAPVSDAVEITTPFLDRNNDRLQIYVERTPHGLRITDDGYTLADLADAGVTLDTPHRSEMLRQILSGFGVQLEEGELTVAADESDFPQKKHALVQAMLSVGDMFVTASPRVVHLFIEDVEHFLDDRDIRFASNIQFSGKSGFSHRFDFLIPKSNSAGERIVRAINHPNREKAQSYCFAWSDTKDARPPASIAYALLNDAESRVSESVISALRSYDIVPIPWSKRDEYAPLLSA